MIFTSAFGIFALVALAAALGFRKAPRLTADEARQLIGDALPGVRADEIIVATDARGALAALSDGQTALVRPHGDKWVVRIVGRADRDGSRLTLRPSEILVGATTLDFGAAAPVWARRLTA